MLTLSTPSLRKSIPLEDIHSVRAIKDQGMGLFYLSIRHGESTLSAEERKYSICLSDEKK